MKTMEIKELNIKDLKPAEYNPRQSTQKQENDLHPTMKPIKLLAGLIKNSSKDNEIIADGFLGSGSTMVARHQLNRRCFGMELDEKYCQVIIDRMKKLDDKLEIRKWEWHTTKKN